MRKLWLACLIAFVTSGAVAQDYPDRQIKLVVPYPPGGSVDPVARMLGADVAQRLKQPVVIDNKAGAAGRSARIGRELAADGYTVLIHTSGLSPNRREEEDLRRHARPGAGDARRDGPLSDRSQSIAARDEHSRADRIREGESRQALVRIRGCRVIRAPDRRDVQGRGGHRHGARAVSGGGPSIAGLAGNEVQAVFDAITASKALSRPESCVRSL